MKEHDLIVLGAGPGGYVAAIRAAQLGLNVAVVEKEKPLGGTCLRVGCIPSKALLESSEMFAEANHRFRDRGIICGDVKLDLAAMMNHKSQVVTTLTGGIDSLFKKNKITRYFGHGKLIGDERVVVDGADSAELKAPHIIIATGSVPTRLPSLDVDDERIGDSTAALSYEEVPKHLVVVGAGYIGLELGTVWRRLGAKVTVVEYLDRIMPGMDSEIAAAARKIFEKQGIEFRLGSKVTGVKLNKRTVDLEIEGADSLRCDRVLVAVGRRPNTQGLGLEEVNIEVDQRGFIPVNPRFQTRAGGYYAIGDVIGGAMLAHKAEEEGIACVEWIVNGYGHVNYQAIPGVVYTHPEIATVGRTEDALKEAGTPYRKGEFPFLANGRARAMGDIDGKVKILADSRTDRILGVHVIGPHAGDLIAEAAVAIEFGASSEDLARACHAHPTLAEAVKEAALAVDGRAIHF